MKLFHLLPSAFSARSKTFTSRPAHFLVVRKLLRAAQRIFCSCGNFYGLPNAFLAHAEIFMSCPAHFLLMRKNLRAAQRIFGSFENFYELPNMFFARAEKLMNRPTHFLLIKLLHWGCVRAWKPEVLERNKVQRKNER